MAIVLTFAVPSLAHAAPVVIDDAFTGRSLGVDLELLEDRSGKLTVGDLARPDAHLVFRQSERDVPSFGFTRSVLWIRFIVEDRRSKPTPLILEAGYAPLDVVTVFADGVEIGSMGDHLAFSARAIPFRLPNLAVEPNGRATYLLRVESSSSVQLPIRLWTRDAFSQRAATDSAVQGLFVGTLASVMVWNLLLFLGARERTHLLYVLYLAGALAFQAAIDGLTFQLLWPNSPWFVDRAMPLTIATVAAFALLFAAEFLDLRRHAPRLHKTSLLLFAVVATLGLWSLVFEPRRVLLTTVALVPVWVLVIALNAAIRVRHGDRPARLFLLAWSFPVAGAAITATRAAGIIPTTMFTTYAQQVGLVIEALLLSLAVAQRISSLRFDAAEAQRLALEEKTHAAASLSALNEELRVQVQDRSRALADALAALGRRASEGLVIGATIDDRYRVVDRLGRGGMGEVVEVERLREASASPSR